MKKLLWKGTLGEMRKHPCYQFAIDEVLSMEDEDSDDIIQFKAYIKEELKLGLKTAQEITK